MSSQKVDIQIPNIEKDLVQFACMTSKDGKNTSKLPKACLFTLVVYAHEERRINYLQELIDTILEKFPCRIIFIQADKNAKTSYFHVSVSNVISGGNSASVGASVTCDQIIIKASYDQIFRIPFVVIPHIVPDLPLYLLWGQNPFEEREIFPHLQPHAARVIFDSECSDNLCTFCKEMEQNISQLKGVDLMDISWALVSNWRDLLIQVFDTAEKIQDLRDIKSVFIKYNGTKTDTMQHPEIRVLYLQAWLATCLGWKYHNTEKFENSLVISYTHALAPAVVALSPVEANDLPPGAITEIDINTTAGTSYSIIRKENLSQVAVHICKKETCEMPYNLPLPNAHRGLTFMREIFFSNLGDRYRGMVKTISELNTKAFK